MSINATNETDLITATDSSRTDFFMSSNEVITADGMIMPLTNSTDVVTANFMIPIVGSNFNDILTGGFGNYYMDGAGGYDILDYSTLGQQITLGAQGFINKGLAGLDQAANVEAIVAPVGFFNLIDGSTAGFNAALNVNLATNSLQVLLASGFSLNFDIFNFVDVVGTSQNDVIIGNGADNILVGAAGNDYVGDLQGFDTLFGGTGGDIFAVADSLNVGYLGNDFATIADWNPFEDLLAINSTFAGSYSFGTGEISGSFAPDTLLFFGNDLVAVIQDSTSISAANILFV